MSELKIRQQQLMDYILGKSDLITDHILGSAAANKALRLHIYRNNYQAGLREVIDTDFEMLGLYLGDNLFDQMVEGYIDAYPSSYSSLRQFGDNLPKFLREDAFFSQYPQLSELARFERLLLRAFDAADAARITQDTLLQLGQNLWPELKLAFHPSVQVFTSHWNVVEIWRALKGEQTPPDPWEQINHWVMWRNQERLTEFRSIDSFEHVMLTAFLKGDDLSQVADTLLAWQSGEDPSQHMVETLLSWHQQGWIQRLRPLGDQPELSLL